MKIKEKNMTYLIGFYLIINLIGFTIMGMDKNRAKKGEWRIKESTLWLVAAIGGALGSYLAMRNFRHKTKHSSFKYGLPILTLVHIGLFVYLSVQLA
ncbi:hypothetical protein COD11_01885 [Bacillus sp. AFS040349]|nr:hypothetical protein COD11_01885 [Bacillus sp. AFS040349]